MYELFMGKTARKHTTGQFLCDISPSLVHIAKIALC